MNMDLSRAAPIASASGRCVARAPVRTAIRTRWGRKLRCCAASDKERSGPDAKQTIADLDALLGIEEDEKKEAGPSADSSRNGKKVEVEVSAEAMNKIRNLEEASQLATLERLLGEKTREQASTSEPGKNGSAADSFREQVRVAQDMLPDAGNVTNEVVQVMKRDILGMSTFLVTEVVFLKDDLLGGVELKGNLRVAPDKVKHTLEQGLLERYGDRYMVYMLNAELEEADAPVQENGFPRIVLRVVPTAVGNPRPLGPVSIFASIVLFALTGASMLSLAAAVAIPKLPSETLSWLAQADPTFSGDVPGLDASFDPVPFFDVFFQVFLGIVAVSAAHEFGHRIAAGARNIRLGPSLFVPNGSLGTFGAVTRPETAFKSRNELWDVAAAGPMAGMITAMALFFYGLTLSMDPQTDPSSLISVPSFLFSGSVVLGGICEQAFGALTPAGKWLVHPLLIAGWCGLFTQAFNLLPVGALDGGKMMQAAFGRSALTFSAILVYLGLVFGFIGGQLAFPFALFVLIAQREPERFIQDDVSEAANAKETVTVVLMFIALLVLIPYSPDAPQLLDSMEANLASQALQSAAQSSGSLQV